MSSFGLNCFVLLFFVSKCSSSVNILSAVSKISTKLIQNIVTNIPDFIDVAAENGYEAEKHEVTTDDGYILTMHRIPPGTNCTRKTPMLVMHGLLQASEALLDAGPEAPGFLFAKDCYDVWFGNSRGNYNSRRHIYLNPDKDLEFWKFSTDEIGLCDIPAMIDYILNTTNSKKLIYVGIAQGGGAFFIMNSERPEYASKISLGVVLAPATRLTNIRSAAFKIFCKSINTMQALLEPLGVWELLGKGQFLPTTFDAPHTESITPDIEKRLHQHFPAGTSVQVIAQYGQAMDDDKFRKYSYGSKKNTEVYGSSESPEYNLRLVKVPTVIYQGLADQIVDPKDDDWAVSQLLNVLDYIKIKDPLWNHLDMTYSRFWKETIYVSMKEYLSQYDSNY